MTRTYTLKKRAEQQADTRQRIVEAAVELHGTVGPAFTTVSMIADRAGVQRHTFYAHFPDDRSLFMACSAHAFERDPLPDAEPWRAIDDPIERLRVGLRAIYDWYQRNEQLSVCVMRDMDTVPLVREVNQLRAGPSRAAFAAILGEKLSAKQRTLLPLALSFFTWRTLARESGLNQNAAVDAMAQAIAGQK